MNLKKKRFFQISTLEYDNMATFLFGESILPREYNIQVFQNWRIPNSECGREGPSGARKYLEKKFRPMYLCGGSPDFFFIFHIWTTEVIPYNALNSEFANFGYSAAQLTAHPF
jgi:hypothetical protein